MAAGIYAITNTITGMQYIGSAADLARRQYEHRQRLNNGTHHSAHLLAAWRKYGSEAFRFDVLEEVSDLACLIEREQARMDERQARTHDWGYNCRPRASNMLGYRRTEASRRALSERYKGRKITWSEKLCAPKSAEHRQKLSEIAKARRWSDEHKARISAKLKGKPKESYTMTEVARAARRRNIAACHTPEAREKALDARRSRPPTEKQLAYWNRTRSS